MMKNPRMLKLKRVHVGDLVGFYFRETPGAETPEPWIGIVVKISQKESLNLMTGRWRWLRCAEIAWQAPATGVAIIKEDEWDTQTADERRLGVYKVIAKAQS